MLHIVIGYNGGKPKALYVGEAGSEADAAYESAKGCETIEHYQRPLPTRKRDGSGASQPTVIRRAGEAPKAEAKPEAKPAKPGK